MHRHGKGIGTVIFCFAAAIMIASVIGHDHEPRPAKARAADRDAEMATDVISSAAPADGRLNYRINKGHVTVIATSGEGKIELGDFVRDPAKITVECSRTVIDVAPTPKPIPKPKTKAAAVRAAPRTTSGPPRRT